ncbi:MAG: PAS domain S-box protein [Planctomycetes bacterium]|nr:PAS domain S-box protein [Planctomycetota bacterium]
MEQRSAAAPDEHPSSQWPWRAYAALAAVAVVTILLIAYAFHKGLRAGRTLAPQVSATTEIKLQATLGHLWFTEILAGDEQEPIEKVWEHFNAADGYVRAMLDGGETIEGDHLVPLTDAKLREEVATVGRTLADFREITRDHWQHRDIARSGSPLDQECDEAFARFLEQAGRLEAALRKSVEREVTVFRQLQTTSIALTVGLFLLAGYYIHTDYREQKLHEAAVAQSRAFLQTVIDAIPESVIVMNADHRIVMANRTARAAAPQEDPVALRMPCHQLLHRVDEPCSGREHPCPLAEVLAAKKVATVEHIHPDASGEERTVEVTASPILNASGEVVQIVESCRDITERLMTMKRLAKSEARFRDLVEGTRDLVTQVDGQGRFTYVNHAAREMLGLIPEECIGLSAFDFIHPEDRESTVKAFNSWASSKVPTAVIENRQVSRKGTVRSVFWAISLHFDENNNVIEINSIGRDITERKRAMEERRKFEAQLQHAQKLESLGVLAGGIAHDFNNLLVAILGNADLALMDMSQAAPARRSVEEIRKAAIRASELTNQMLAYSGKGRFIVRAVSLNELVEELGHLLQVSISKKTVLKLNLAADLPAVKADVSQLRQVVMNLITNAADAIGEASGAINITTGVLEASKEYIDEMAVGENLPAGYYVYLEVSDTGCGMDNETKARLFDPFFTTKFTGRGLGLAAVLGIVRGHAGAIRVYSEPGRGSTFKVLLPCTSDHAEALGRTERSAPADWHGSGTILVVDDEDTVRSVTKMMLTRLGFDVLTAEDGVRALDVFRRRADEIVCVLLDMTMPRMGGEEAFRELRQIRRDVKVILCSGYNEQDATNRFAGKGLAGFMQKPYQMEILSRKLRAALEGDVPSSD